MMEDFRGDKAPKTLAGSPVVLTKDYEALTTTVAGLAVGTIALFV